ncbi:hypothetical protein PENTCL1PPCAC_4688, partial [Pristionchus entomophagus]
CLSYTHKYDHCVLLGKMDAAPVCALPRTEIVKKSKDEDCAVNFSQQPIEKEYIRNPDTATGTVVAINTTNSRPCGTNIVVIDATLPDSSHMVLGNTFQSNLTWDAKLGSWILTEGVHKIYLRGAQCIEPLSSE